LIAKPTVSFTEQKQYLLDQYLAGGGSAMLLLESHRLIQPGEVEGLPDNGKPMAVSVQTGLKELLFHTGLRFKPGIVSDMYATPIVVATGEGTDSQYNPLMWLYYPMVFPNKEHPVSANISPLQLRYTGGWDTLPRPELRKTVLLGSSPFSRLESFPRSIDLQLAGQEPDPRLFRGRGDIPLGVLVEGDYTSFYANKVRPLKLGNHKDSGSGMRLLAVADGDLIANQFNEQGKPLELGFDKWTSSFYGNKAFLINALHYLMDEEELLTSRARSISIPRLDPVRVKEKLPYWQGFTLIWPIVLIAITAFLILSYRNRRYKKPLA
jgi:gliding-associated putative ABC transporter substrate-binding component GldG